MFRRLIVASLLLLAGPALAQQLPQPTKAHQMMAREAGVWDAKVQMWPAPGAPAVESTATETCEMLGDFWMTARFEGDMGGVPFAGLSQTGFDPESGDYIGTWIDTMVPQLTSMRGQYDVAKHELTMLTEVFKCCMTGANKRLKMVTTYVDDDHKHFEIHEQADGSDEWRKSMAIDYTRRK
jgi:hypothetical protein